MTLTDEDRDHFFRIGLYGLCEGLRMGANGGGDPWPDEKVVKAKAYLRERLDQWSPSQDYRKTYDDAVKAMIEALFVELDYIEQERKKYLALWQEIRP